MLPCGSLMLRTGIGACDASGYSYGLAGGTLNGDQPIPSIRNRWQNGCNANASWNDSATRVRFSTTTARRILLTQ